MSLSPSSSSTKHRCLCCGYRELQNAQRSPKNVPSLEVCPSCGFTPGNTDDVLGLSLLQWREKWVALGMVWFSENVDRPEPWRPFNMLSTMLKRKRRPLPSYTPSSLRRMSNNSQR